MHIQIGLLVIITTHIPKIRNTDQLRDRGLLDEVQAYFATQQLDTSDARELFNLLDQDGDGEVPTCDGEGKLWENCFVVVIFWMSIVLDIAMYLSDIRVFLRAALSLL